MVEQALEEWGVGPDDPAASVRDDLVLIASELVTNAVRFCREAIEMRVEAHRNRIEVAVVDDHPAPAHMVQAMPDAIGGRGLSIVETLSERWGQRPFDGRSKEVWSSIRIDAPSVLADGCRI